MTETEVDRGGFDPDSTEAELVRIHGLDGVQRKRAVDEFHQRRWSVYEAWAQRFVSAFGIPRAHFDDVVAEIAARAAEAVEEWEPGWARRWEAMMWAICRTHIREKVDNGTFSGLTGRSTTERRRRRLKQTRTAQARRFGREPSKEEILSEYNAEVSETYKDAARSGMLANKDDLWNLDEKSPQRPLSGTKDDDQYGSVGEWDFDPTETSLLAPTESEELLSIVLSVCHQVHPDLSAVGETWLGRVAEDGRIVLKGLAEEFGISRGKASELQRLVRRIGVAVLYRKYGIGDGTWGDRNEDLEFSVPTSKTVDGVKVVEWLLPDGTLHRTDGPALYSADGKVREFWLDGDEVNEENLADYWDTDS